MRVRYTLRARSDIAAIFDYIEAQNASAARDVRKAIDHAVQLAADFPYIGAATDRSPAIRSVRAGRHPYRIYYRVGANEIRILHVRDMRRRPWAG